MRPPDWLALGRHLLRGGRRADGWRALRSAIAAPDEAPSARAGLLLARELTRRRRYASAERLLASLQQRLAHGQPPEPGVSIALARARLLEWKLADLARALEVVDAGLASASPGSPQDLDLQYRRAS
jgi:hypothetical protein